VVHRQLFHFEQSVLLTCSCMHILAKHKQCCYNLGCDFVLSLQSCVGTIAGQRQARDFISQLSHFMSCTSPPRAATAGSSNMQSRHEIHSSPYCPSSSGYLPTQHDAAPCLVQGGPGTSMHCPVEYLPEAAHAAVPVVRSQHGAALKSVQDLPRCFHQLFSFR
jgi:hypothetical protein